MNEIALRSFEDDGEVLIGWTMGLESRRYLPRILSLFYHQTGWGWDRVGAVDSELVERMGESWRSKPVQRNVFRLRLHAVEGWSGEVRELCAPRENASFNPEKFSLWMMNPRSGACSPTSSRVRRNLGAGWGRGPDSAQEEHFDAVLCDLMMPVMTGMELYHQCVASTGDGGALVFLTGERSPTRHVSFWRQKGHCA